MNAEEMMAKTLREGHTTGATATGAMKAAILAMRPGLYTWDADRRDRRTGGYAGSYALRGEGRRYGDEAGAAGEGGTARHQSGPADHAALCV